MEPVTAYYIDRIVKHLININRFTPMSLFDSEGVLIPFVWVSASHWYSSYTGADEAGYWKWIDTLETDEYYRWIGYHNDLCQI